MSKDYAPIGRREFTHDGATYVYEYDALKIGAGCTAKNLFEYHHQMLINPPRSARELTAAGGDDYVLRCMAHVLLLKEKDADELRAVSPEAVYRFLSELPISYMKQLEECKADFFTRSKTQNVPRMLVTARSLSVARLAASLWESTPEPSAPDGSPSETAASSGSTILPNADAV